MNDKDITYDELLNACITQNEIRKLMDDEQVDVGQLQHEIEILRKLHIYASYKRRIAAIKQLQDDIHENITTLVDALRA